MSKTAAKYFIFTDESGSWGDRSSKFYVRSWLKILYPEYVRLRQISKKGPPSDYLRLLNSTDQNTKVFITFTVLEEFYLRRFVIRDDIASAIQQVISQLSVRLKDYMRTIPRGVENAVNHTLFLNTYERFHFENAKEYLNFNPSEDLIILDTPQFHKNDYRALFEEIGIVNYRIFSSSRGNSYRLGIKIADRIAPCFRGVLLGRSPLRFSNFIGPKLTNKGNFLPGVNKVFLINTKKELELASKLSGKIRPPKAMKGKLVK